MTKDYISLSSDRWEEFKYLQKEGLIPIHGEFSPAGVHYPPITNYSYLTPQEAYRDYNERTEGVFDVYVHIPFCYKRCLFCHYPSLYRADDQTKDTFLDYLEKEMQIFLRLKQMDKIRVRSILIGGGTPTALNPKQFERFLTFFSSYVDIENCKQFNYDVDPSTLVGEDGLQRLQLMKDFQGDRMTIGIQSLDNNVLKRMNRSHDAKTAIESIENCRKFGFDVNIEFIFGHPGETLQNWIEVMGKAVRLDVDEIQLYRLKVEPYGDQEGTIKKYEQYHKEELISVEDTIRMKEIANLILADHGYKENLRRVFTKSKRHISLYAYNQCCRLLDQVGFGVSAFSSYNDRFLLNTPSFKEYYEKIDAGFLPVNRGLIRNPEQKLIWSAVLPLKNYFIDKKLFSELNGVDVNSVFGYQISALKKYGFAEETAGKIALTHRGAFYSDEIVHLFYEPVHQSFPVEDFNQGELNPYMVTTKNINV